MEMEKGFAEDLSEGKFSFPIIHGIKSHPENNELINILERYFGYIYKINFSVS